MALSIEERERIREDEWVRALAREDFKKQAGRDALGQNSFTGMVYMFVSILGLMGIFFLFIRLFGEPGS